MTTTSNGRTDRRRPLPWLALALAACSSGASIPTATSPEPRELPAWTAADRIPLLEGRRRRQPAGDRRFETSAGVIQFTDRRAPPGSSEPFATDAEAVAAAVAFCCEQFGPLQCELLPVAIDHSASGNDAPRDDADRGHTVVLVASHRGLPVDPDGAVVYLRGRHVHLATIFFSDYSERPDSALPCIDAVTAIDVWRGAMVARGAPADQVAEFAAKAEPQLVFDWKGSKTQAGVDVDRRPSGRPSCARSRPAAAAAPARPAATPSASATSPSSTTTCTSSPRPAPAQPSRAASKAC